jgi:hypothetical protein
VKATIFITTTIITCFPGISSAQNETNSLFVKLAPQSEAVAMCYRISAIKFASLTCESAATVVNAAFGNCALQEKAYGDAMLKIAGRTYAGIPDGIIAKAKSDSKQALLSIVLSIRSNQRLCLENSK